MPERDRQRSRRPRASPAGPRGQAQLRRLAAEPRLAGARRRETVYEHLFGETPIVTAVHAGLETAVDRRQGRRAGHDLVRPADRGAALARRARQHPDGRALLAPARRVRGRDVSKPGGARHERLGHRLRIVARRVVLIASPRPATGATTPARPCAPRLGRRRVRHRRRLGGPAQGHPRGTAEEQLRRAQQRRLDRRHPREHGLDPARRWTGRSAPPSRRCSEGLERAGTPDPPRARRRRRDPARWAQQTEHNLRVARRSSSRRPTAASPAAFESLERAGEGARPVGRARAARPFKARSPRSTRRSRTRSTAAAPAAGCEGAGVRRLLIILVACGLLAVGGFLAVSASATRRSAAAQPRRPPRHDGRPAAEQLDAPPPASDPERADDDWVLIAIEGLLVIGFIALGVRTGGHRTRPLGRRRDAGARLRLRARPGRATVRRDADHHRGHLRRRGDGGRGRRRLHGDDRQQGAARAGRKSINFAAPFVSYLLCILTGTSNTFYSIIPVINEVSYANKIRPERPLAGLDRGVGLGITSSPVAAAMATILPLVEV